MSRVEGPVAIIGLGLMGGSLARDLSEQGVEVLGFDRHAAIVEAALQSGTITASLPDDLAGLDAARIVIVATPVDAAASALPTVALRSDSSAVITDVGSTKRSIEQAAAEAGLARRFIGSHPLAGDHRSGWNAARAHLYEGAAVFICPGPMTDPGAHEAVAALWRSVGADPVVRDAAHHDRLMAMVSHLPQVLATALATVMTNQGLTSSDLGPGGRDMTRLAESSPEMWAAISHANADNLTDAINRLEEALAELRRQLAEDDRNCLRDFFEAGRKLRG